MLQCRCCASPRLYIQPDALLYHFHLASSSSSSLTLRTRSPQLPISFAKGIRVWIIMNLEHFICFVKVISSAINAALMQHPKRQCLFCTAPRNAIVNMRQYFHKYTIWLRVDTIPILWRFDPIRHTHSHARDLHFVSFLFVYILSHDDIPTILSNITFTLTFRSFVGWFSGQFGVLCHCAIVQKHVEATSHILCTQHETVATNNGMKTAKTKTNNQQQQQPNRA